MSREEEKFNRALNRFIKDNPDLDKEKALEEFEKYYKAGDYALKDFTKADEIFEEALKLDDVEHIKSALKQALDIYPKHYEAKGELIVLETEDKEELVIRLSSLLNEIRNDLEDNEGISLKKVEESLWNTPEVRPYLRNMFKLMMVYADLEKYDEALNLGKELLRLDPENHQSQSLFYLIYLLGQGKYENALNDSNAWLKIDDHSKYIFISFLASVYLRRLDEALGYVKKLARYNMTYLCLMLGIAKLGPTDYEKIFGIEFVEQESFEDAARVFFCLNKIIFSHFDELNEFIEKYSDDLMNLIDPTPEGMEVLFILEAKKEASLMEVLSYISQLDDKLDFAKLKNKNELENKKVLLELKNKKYIGFRDAKFFVTFLGYSVLVFLVGDGENENN